jgi:hypothetical protein
MFQDSAFNQGVPNINEEQTLLLPVSSHCDIVSIQTKGNLVIKNIRLSQSKQKPNTTDTFARALPQPPANGVK